MIRGFKNLRGIVAAFLVAASVVCAVPANSLTAHAALKVDIAETTQIINKRGGIGYKETGNSMVTITPGTYAKNVLTISINDEDAKIKNEKCSKNLKFKKSYKKYDDDNSKVIYRYSFYTNKSKLFKFKFTVDGQQYTTYINSTTPVQKATFAGKELSTKFGLGTYSYITDLKKGKFKVNMSKGYNLESIQVGKYKNTKNGNTVEPVLYWTTIKNNKKVSLSGEKQVTESSDGEVFEDSMYATTVLRVNYRYTKNNTTGCVDYYLNRIVDFDN